MNSLRMINPSSAPAQADPPIKAAPSRHAISLRKAVGRTTLFETTMMSFHTSTRWSRRAARTLLAVVLFAAATGPINAQETTAAKPPVAISQTNPPVSVKPADGAPGAKNDPTAGSAAKETTAPVPVKSPGPIVSARTNVTPVPLSIDTFKLIAGRNIFNQSRVRGRTESVTTQTIRNTPRPRVEAIALGGTMIYENGSFAFFGGSSQYRKTVKAGDSIGAYKLAEVGANQVKLVGEKQEWVLKVGQELRRENEGEWNVGASSGLLAGSESTTSSTPNSSTDAPAVDDSESNGSEPAPAADAGGNEVLRRLLEARAKEVGR